MVDVNTVRSHMVKVVESLEEELKALRVGRATPSLIENIEVNVYGSRIPISQLGNINVVDAHLLTIGVWDKGNIQEVVKAILEANTGLSPISDGDVIRVPIPPITEERRLSLVKNLGQIGEESKVKVRQVRKDFLDDLKKSLDAKEITEDDESRLKDQLQKTVDEFNKEIDTVVEKKKQDLMSV